LRIIYFYFLFRYIHPIIKISKPKGEK